MSTPRTAWTLGTPASLDIAGRLAAQALVGAMAVVCTRDSAVDLAAGLRTVLPVRPVTLVVTDQRPPVEQLDLIAALLGLGQVVLAAVPPTPARTRVQLRPLAYQIAQWSPGFTVAFVDDYGIVWLPAAQPVSPDEPTWLAGGRPAPTGLAGTRSRRTGRAPSTRIRHATGEAGTH